MEQLILIRHGKTDYNDGRFFGHSDIGLNGEGVDSINRIKGIIEQEEIGRIFCSDLKRCRETADLLNLTDSIEYTEKLREADFGLWEGKTFSQINEEYSGMVKKWQDDWINFRIPGGESLVELSNRVMGKLEEILNLEVEKVCIVGHFGSLEVILTQLLFGNLSGYWKFRIENATINRINFDKGFPYLVSFNEYNRG